MEARTFATFSAFFLLWALAGCSAEIGDECTTNVDCSPLGDRICDIAQKDGYCTVLGCDADSCPDDALCIRFFSTSFLFTPCNPLTEDTLNPALEPTNDCTTSELCLSSGYCAQRTSEQRFCMKPCESNDDCRSGYECRDTGTQGAEPVPDPDSPGYNVQSFCAQRL